MPGTESAGTNARAAESTGKVTMSERESDEVVDTEVEEIEAGTDEDAEVDDSGEEDAGGDEGSEKDEDETSEDEDDDQNEEDRELGNRAQKRIKKLNGRVKDAERRVAELEQELDAAKKMGGDEGKLYVRAAETAGILPSLMTKELAEGLNEIERKRSAVEFYGQFLDGDEDECELGGSSYSRRQIERFEQRARSELADLKERFGAKEAELQGRVKAIFELGLKAQKAVWTGAEKPKTKKVSLNKPAGRSHPAKRMDDDGDFGDVVDEDDLEAAIIAMRRKK